jgi:iron complex transport system substrate-binding protein
MTDGLLALALVLGLSLAPFPVWAISFVDDSGRTVTFEAPFQRIVSLYGAHTENLCSLGLESALVGVSENDDWPATISSKPRFSVRDDAERFIASGADLVLVRPMVWERYGQLVEQLERAGMRVVALQPRTAEELRVYWRRLGELTGRTVAAESMHARFEAELEALRGRTAQIPLEQRKRVFFESIHGQMKTFAPDSMALFALRAAGGVNAAADAQANRSSNIADYGHERLLALGPRIDVYLAQVGPMNRVTREEILEEKGFRAIKAVVEGKVFLVDEELVSRPTLRLLEGVRVLGKRLYPELFR